MMMKMNVQVLCEDLDQLLKDICDFLSNQINDDNLTESQRLFANRLVQRSKKQLQQVSQVSMALSTDVDDSSYVDMNKQSAVEVEEVTYEEGGDTAYTPIICPQTLPNSEQIVCPYESLPATELEKCEKFGHLDRKGRFLFIGHQRKLFAGIKDQWLLLYCAKKDSKPSENLNLSFFSAKPLEGARTKTFELTCLKTQKAYQFVAQTPKDMAQWVACVNKRANYVAEAKKIEVEGEGDDEIENIYEPLKMEEELKDTLKKRAKPLPPLPKTPENNYILRQQKPEMLPPEMETYDAVVQRELPKMPENPHVSDDEEENIYDCIQDAKAEQQKQAKPPQKPLPAPPPTRHPKIAQLNEQESTWTNSFSEDDDEERIYDVLEQARVSPLFPSRLIKRPPDPEPEEEYSNLVTNDSAHHSEPEEEYCNLVSLQNTRNTRVCKPNIAPMEEPEEPEEQYINVALNPPITEIRSLPRSAAWNARSLKPNPIKKQEIEEPEDEYSNLVASTTVTEKNGSSRKPSVKAKPVNHPPKVETKAVVEEDEEECEYDCVVSHPSLLSNKSNHPNNGANIPDKRSLNSNLSNNQAEKPGPPPLKPKPKMSWNR